MTSSSASPERKSLAIHDIELSYEVRGHGEPLLLLHGFTGAGSDWRHVFDLDALAREFQLILPDLRGHGGSTNPSGALTIRRCALDRSTRPRCRSSSSSPFPTPGCGSSPTGDTAPSSGSTARRSRARRWTSCAGVRPRPRSERTSPGQEPCIPRWGEARLSPENTWRASDTSRWDWRSDAWEDGRHHPGGGRP